MVGNRVCNIEKDFKSQLYIELGSEGLIYEKIESEDEDTDGGRPENMVGRAEIEPVPPLNLPKPVRLVSLAVLQGIPTIATKESSTERYSENI